MNVSGALIFRFNLRIEILVFHRIVMDIRKGKKFYVSISELRFF